MSKDQTAQFNVVDGMRHARSCPYLWTPRGTCDCHPLDEAKAMRAPDLLSIFKPLPQDEADALREYLDDMSSKDEAAEVELMSLNDPYRSMAYWARDLVECLDGASHQEQAETARGLLTWIIRQGRPL